MRKILTATWIAAALFAADTGREQTLQRAIDLMESKGDLAKAMPLFEDVSRSADKSLAARALLYLGQAQERQAAQKARATYERIIREFSGQTESVAVARRRLSALGSAPPSGMLAQRLICPDCGDNEADIAPDGRSMLMTDWDTGDLAIRDLATNHVRRLMIKPGSWTDSKAFAETPIFSSDLRQIAYLWYTGEKENSFELRVVANEPGSKARTLLKTPENGYYYPAAWSGDGKSVLALLEKAADRTCQLAWISAADGSIKTLTSLQWRTLNVRGRAVLSPDGRYVAFAALATNPKSGTGPIDSTHSRIYIIAADGSSETAIVKTAGINENPIWTPDGKHLLFNSDSAGSFGLWSVAIENGSAVAPPSLVMPGLGRIHANGMTRSGSYHYSTNGEGVETIGIAESGASHRAAELFAGIRPTWSPDSIQLAFFRHRPPAGGDSYDLVVHSLATGEEVVYDLDGLRPAPARWFHDGKSIMVQVGNPRKTRGLYRLDLNTKKFTQVLESDTVSGVYAISPDDQTIYNAGRYDKDNRVVMDRILVIDAKTGQQKQTLPIPALGAIGLQLSPDGRTLVILHVDSQAHRTRFALMSVDGSGYREIYSVNGGSNRQIDNMAWAKDGRAVLFGLPKDGKWPIVRISTSGGSSEPSEFDLKDAGFLQIISLSPDGKRLAFSAQRNISELWAIDNILSVLK